MYFSLEPVLGTSIRLLDRLHNVADPWSLSSSPKLGDKSGLDPSSGGGRPQLAWAVVIRSHTQLGHDRLCCSICRQTNDLANQYVDP